MQKKILNIVSILLGALMMNAGLNKFLNYMPVPPNIPEEVMKDGAAMMEICWLMPLIAIAEILGGFLLLFRRTRALGLLIVFPVMVGVLLTHIFVAPDGLIMALVIWAIMLWIIYDNRDKFINLIR